LCRSIDTANQAAVSYEKVSRAIECNAPACTIGRRRWPAIPAKAAGPVAGSRGHDLCGTIHSANAIFTGVHDKKIPRAVDCDARWVNEHGGRSWPPVTEPSAVGGAISCGRGDHMRGGIHTPNLAYPAFSLRNKEVSRTVDR